MNLKLDVKLDLGVAGCLQNENLEFAEGVQGPPKMRTFEIGSRDPGGTTDVNLKLDLGVPEAQQM